MTSSTNCKTFALLPTCSNHGKCDELIGKCICDNGWTSIGDFSTQQGIHCGIHVITIRVLWMFATITSLPALYLSIMFLLTKVKKGNKSTWELIIDPQIMVRRSFFIAILSDGLLSILKVIDQELFAIALHPASTISFYTFFVATVMGGCAYIILMINFVRGYIKMMSSDAKKSIKAQSEAINKVAYFVMVIVPFIFCPPLVNLTHPNNDRATLVALLVGSIFVSVFFVFALVRYLGVIAREIGKFLELGGEHLNSNNGEDGNNMQVFVKLKTKFERARIAVILAGIQIITLYSLFPSLDVLALNTSYIWPTIIVTVNVVFSFLIKSMMNDSGSSSSSDTRNSKDNRGGDLNIAVIPKYADTNDATAVTKPTSDDKYPNHTRKPTSDANHSSSSTKRVIPIDDTKE